MFLDEAKINVKSGDGGNGAVAFAVLKDRKKKIALGGTGGRGGDVIIEASTNLSTLYSFKNQIHFKAENGQRGSVNNKTGKNGSDIIILVPAGTIIKDDLNEVIIDLKNHGDKAIISRGGIGGRGNASFVCQRLKFPGFAEKGEKTEEIWLNLELRLIADAALAGLPNAGKSTLISKISNAKPKIASYPFTTITPNLGVVYFAGTSFTVADIPGIIKGAHKGVGLGDKFLRHIMRTSIIVFILDCFEIISGAYSASENFLDLREEIKLYDSNLYEREHFIVLNKIDTASGNKEVEKICEELRAVSNKEVIAISAATGENVETFIKVLSNKIRIERERLIEQSLSEEPEASHKVYKLDDRKSDNMEFEISQSNGEYTVKNKSLERMVSMTDLENEEALDYLRNKLQKMRIGDKLKKIGIPQGATVIIGKLVFELV